MNARAEDVVADDVAADEQELTLREEIEQARDDVVERHERESQTQEPAQGGDRQGGRERDEHGRFVPRAQPGADSGGESRGGPQGREQPRPNGATGEGAANAPAAGATAASGQANNAQNGSQHNIEIAPNSWSAQAKAEWSKLTPTVRAEIMRRETEVHRTLTRQDEERQLGNSISAVVQQNRDFFERAGVTPQRLFSDYLQISKILGGSDINAKAQLLRNAALQNGINLHALAAMGGARPNPAPSNAGNGAQPQPANQPIPFHQLPPEVQQMYRDNQERVQREQREAQEARAREEQASYDEIVAFRAQPQARFFDAVRDQMVALLNANAATTLEEAYQTACWARPDIREVLLREQQEQAAAAQRSRLNTQNARRKSVSVRGGAGSQVESAPPNRSLREELEHNFKEAQRSRV